MTAVSSLETLVVVCNWVVEAGRMIGWKVELACSRGLRLYWCCPSWLPFPELFSLDTSLVSGIKVWETEEIWGAVSVECGMQNLASSDF